MHLEKSSLWYKKVHLVRVRVSICCQSTDVCWVLEIVLIAGVIAVVLRLSNECSEMRVSPASWGSCDEVMKPIHDGVTSTGLLALL